MIELLIKIIVILTLFGILFVLISPFVLLGIYLFIGFILMLIRNFIGFYETIIAKLKIKRN